HYAETISCSLVVRQRGCSRCPGCGLDARSRACQRRHWMDAAHDRDKSRGRTMAIKLTQPSWIATTSNDYRPMAIESALCKGSRGIFAPDVSRYVTSLFPNFHCALAQSELTGVEGSSVGFLRLPTESLAGSVKRVEDYFSVSLALHVCHEIPAPGSFM